MPATFFFLGSTPELSYAEIAALLPQQAVRILPTVVQADLSVDQAQTIQQKSGGVVKTLISKQFLENSSEEIILTSLVALLSEYQRPTFAISHVSDTLSFEPTQIKKLLKEKNIPSRYLDGKRYGLPAAIWSHHPNIIDLVLIPTDNGLHIAQTITMQDIDDWTKRDRSKPYADRKKGMLPPKVARMMVNIAAGQLSSQTTPVIYDPFCGTGTILMEAAMLGYETVGSDLSQKTITGAESNMAWLVREYDLTTNTTLFSADATAAAPQKLPLNCIVTEPFLGKPTPKLHEIPNIVKGLQKLYLGVFKHWTGLLAAENSLVVILPAFSLQGEKSLTFQSFIDEIRKFGYTTSSEPIRYARPGAQVERDIYILKYIR